MRRMFAALLLVGFATPAGAEDDLKKMGDEARIAYMECFNKHEPACIAALYTPDGMLVSPMGVHKPVEYYDNSFKAGADKLELTMAQIHPVGADAVIATGTFHVTGKDAKSGAPIDLTGNWGATYIKEGGKLKVRMVTTSPKPPPAKQ